MTDDLPVGMRLSILFSVVLYSFSLVGLSVLLERSQHFPQYQLFASHHHMPVSSIVSSGVARGGAGGANAPPQIFLVPLLPKTPIGNRST